jgi:hypothetical protein
LIFGLADLSFHADDSGFSVVTEGAAPMKAFAGSFALALMLSCLSAPAPAAPVPNPAPQDADQPEGVEQPTKGTVKEVHLDRHARVMNSTCNPTRVYFTGRIKTDGPAFVTYRWLRSDGTHKDVVLQFTKADGRPVSTDWNQKSTYSGWVQLVVLAPAHVETPKAYFQVHCGTGEAAAR